MRAGANSETFDILKIANFNEQTHVGRIALVDHTDLGQHWHFDLLSPYEVSFTEPVLPNIHCALRASADILLMLKNPIGFVRMHRPCQSLNVALSRLFKYLIYKETLKKVF